MRLIYSKSVVIPTVSYYEVYNEHEVVSVNNKRVIPIGVINFVIIISVMAFVALLTQDIIDELSLRDIQNVARLTQTNIYSDIAKELVEPVNTSVIMAQNTVMFDFMNEDTPATEDMMAEYLSSIQNVTGYESVFVVPHSTLSYYHPGGTDAKVDLNSEDSFWYKNRIDANDTYALLVNTEQLDDYALTIYVDANMENDNGEFIGVAGVGKRLDHLQDILGKHMNNHGVEAYLISEDGQIQIHNNSDLIKTTTLYEYENVQVKELPIQRVVLHQEKQIGNKFIIMQYIPMLDWYLVVTKSTSELAAALNHYSIKMYTALGLAVMTMMIATSYTISRYKKQIINLSNIDQLTKIPNRTIFEKELEGAVKGFKKRSFCLALIDLDNLKTINDQFGHDIGDYVLRRIAEVGKTVFRDPNIMSRVGGDEFGVILYKPLDESGDFLNDFREKIENDTELKRFEVTVSMGLTESMLGDTEQSIFKRADVALYQSKEEGKNQVKTS